MDALKPVSRRTLSEQVAAQLVLMISAGTFKAGDRLPCEAELCQSLNVGRSTLREGLKALSFAGIVRMRAGEGTFVADGHSDFLDWAFGHGLLREAKDVKDLFETRELLESRLAALCAHRATDAELLNLEHIVNKMAQAVHHHPIRFAQLDLEFHLAVATFSKNRVMANLYQAMSHIVREWIRKSGQVPGAQRNALARHREILEALKQRSPRKASTAMRRHLYSVPRPLSLLLAAREPARTLQQRAMTGEPRPGKAA